MNYTPLNLSQPNINTHNYDHKIKEVSMNFKNNIKYSIQQKNEWISLLLKEKENVHPDLRDSFVNSLNIIKRDIVPLELKAERLSNPANYDHTNELWADDLLSYISQKYITTLDEEAKKDILLNIAIQLSDMTTGYCPQGRVIRLWQIVMLFDGK